MKPSGGADRPSTQALRAQLRAAELSCAAHGLELSGARRHVLELLLAAAAPVGAYELMTRWRGGRERTTPPSVYRALHALEACGLVCKIESLNAYQALTGPARGAPPAFLVCQACQSATELDLLDVGPVRRAADRQGFQVRRWALEAVGLCEACRAAEGDILPGRSSARWTRRR